MPLTAITVVYGTNGLFNPDGSAAAGTITLAPTQEVPDSHNTVVVSARVFPLVGGQMSNTSPTFSTATFDTNGQASFQALVTENIVGAKNPAPYVVNIPASGTLDLSQVSRGTVGQTTPLYIPLSAVSALGDLIVGSSAGAVARLPAGANGLVLTADSTKPLGVGWEAAGAGTVTSVAAADGTIVIGGTPTVAPTVKVGTIAEAQVTNLVSDLAAKVALSLVTTKGDLLAATGAGALARLAAGSDGLFLTTASGQPSGLQWVVLPKPTIVSGFIATGNVAAVNTGGTFLPIAGTSKSISASVGDQLSALYGFSTLDAGGTYYDVGVIGAGGSLVRLLGTSLTPGPSMTYEGMGDVNPDAGVKGQTCLPPFVATSSDIVGGTVTFCVAWRSSGAGTFLMNADVPVTYSLRNDHQ
jgi:hypothetical protein